MAPLNLTSPPSFTPSASGNPIANSRYGPAYQALAGLGSPVSNGLVAQRNLAHANTPHQVQGRSFGQAPNLFEQVNKYGLGGIGSFWQKQAEYAANVRIQRQYQALPLAPGASRVLAMA